MKIFIDDEKRPGPSLVERIARVRAEHQIGRVIPPPGTGIGEVILGIE